jgi:type IV pilus assembly protein PilE
MQAPCPVPAPSRRLERGFTLIELLIALVVLGILTAIALPSFNESFRKSRRSEAFAALSGVQQAQERWRTNHSSYTTDMSSTGINLPTTTSGGYYGIAVDAADPVSYSVTATGAAGTTQANDGNCVRLRMRSAGGNIFYGSAAATGTFDEAAGNRCWAK